MEKNMKHTKKIAIIFALIIGITFFFSCSANARYIVKPGQQIPLILDNHKIDTERLGIVGPSWQPEKVKWTLEDPTGKTVFVVEDSLTKKSTGSGAFGIGDAEWIVSTNSGTITIPAFSKPGEYTLKATFFKSGLIISGEATETITHYDVAEASLSENLMAPMVFPVEDIPLIGSFTLYLQVIYLIGIAIIIPLSIIVFLLYKPKKLTISRRLLKNVEKE